MTAALADAQTYGPQTDAIAREVAARFNGCVTDINYKTRESATRKCITDNSRPYDLKDLARTTIVAGWDYSMVFIATRSQGHRAADGQDEDCYPKLNGLSHHSFIFSAKLSLIVLDALQVSALHATVLAWAHQFQLVVGLVGGHGEGVSLLSLKRFLSDVFHDAMSNLLMQRLTESRISGL